MSTKRPFVMSIAGLDPSGGAGLLADIKTFEQHKVLGLGVASAVTYQNEDQFHGMEWFPEKYIFNQIESLLQLYKPAAVKVGIIESPDVLFRLICWLRERLPKAKIIWDPILQASAGYDFHTQSKLKDLSRLLNIIDLITPNMPECTAILGTTDPDQITQITNCNVLLKGGHSEGAKACDLLITSEKTYRFEHEKKHGYSKHGTGCILSAAIAANLARGLSLADACQQAKEYIQPILCSNSTRLAYHYE